MAIESGLTATHLSRQILSHPRELQTRWDQVDFLEAPEQRVKGYVVGFAASEKAVQMALRLRYEVFNLELQEGLPSSLETGLDRDPFDDQMTHLLVLDTEGRHVVGTYRLQTVEQARAGQGLYSAQEYDLTPIEHQLDQAVECGRACTAKAHRKASALLALWEGIHVYMSMYRLRWLFGCCSLTSTDPDDGWRGMKTLREKGFLWEQPLVSPRPDFSCGDPAREMAPELGPGVKLPKLFSTYMRLGGKVVSLPAWDRAFGTVDFLVLLDGHNARMSSLALGK